MENTRNTICKHFHLGNPGGGGGLLGQVQVEWENQKWEMADEKGEMTRGSCEMGTGNRCIVSLSN